MKIMLGVGFAVLLSLCLVVVLLGRTPVPERYVLACESDISGTRSFDPLTDQTFNLGEVPGRSAWYRPKPEGGSRQDVLYERSSVIRARQDLCDLIDNDDYDPARAENLFLEIDGSVFESPMIVSTSSASRTPTRGLLFYNGDRTYIPNVGQYRSVVRTSSATRSIEMIFNTGEFSVLLSVPSNRLPGISDRQRVCSQLNWIRERWALGAQPRPAMIPRCAELLAARIKPGA